MRLHVDSTVPERSVFLAHALTFGSVVSTLWLTEGTLALGSKWCTCERNQPQQPCNAPPAHTRPCL